MPGGIKLEKNTNVKRKVNKVAANPGWANPFGNKPALSKDILLGKGDPIPSKKSKQPAVSKRYGNGDHPQNQNSLEATNVKSSLHETEEFIFKGISEKLPKEANVRRNVVNYEDLVEGSDMGDEYKVNEPEIDKSVVGYKFRNAMPKSSAQYSSYHDRGIFDKSEDINGLLKDIVTEQDDELTPAKPKGIGYSQEMGNSNMRYNSNFDESGQLVLDTEFERLVGSKESLNQTGNRFEAGKFQSSRLHLGQEQHAFDENNNVKTSFDFNSKDLSRPKDGEGVGSLDDFDW